MKKYLPFAAIIVALSFNLIQASQKSGFEFEPLSMKGRAAYKKLLSARIFRVGGVGFAGVTSEEELALYDLLREKKAVESLRSLVREATYEGGLYGLLGLSITNVAEFKEAVEVYKARDDPQKKKAKEPFGGVNLPRDAVVTQFGCIVSSEDRMELVKSIQSGSFEKLLRRPVDLTNASDDELQQHLGERVTMNGRFSLYGKVGPFILVGGRPIYLEPKGSFSWGEPYTNFEGQDVRITGTLRYAHYGKSPPGALPEGRAKDHFYFEAETAQVTLTEK